MNRESQPSSSGADQSSGELVTRTGFHFRVRRVREDDEPALAEFFRRVTPDDLRFRFLTSVDEVSHSRLLDMIRVDQERTESFLVTADGEAGPVIAVAMLAADPENETAEVAISIRGDHKGRGIGWTLLDHLAHHARSKGIKVLEAIESRDNHAAISLEREMGFVAEPVAGDPAVVALRRRLG
jgi:GNAT superfamily N-acetyltransferase